MKKIAFVILLFLVVMMCAVQSDAGQLCWNILPYTDIVKVSTVNTLYGHVQLNGVWLVSGVTLMPVTGTMEKTLDGLNKRVALFAAAADVGYEQCVLQATVDLTLKEGDAIWTCNGGTVGPINGTLDRVSCSSLHPLNLEEAIESWTDK